MELKRNISRVYLYLVPLFTSLAAYGIGHISYKIYLPVWTINVCLMTIAVWCLSRNLIYKNTIEKKHIIYGSYFLIVSWMLISMLFGFGQPPESAEEWVATATEQQVRYALLLVAGICVAMGFGILRAKIKNTENFYSMLGFIALLIAIPLFIVNMIFWGSFLTEFFKTMVSTGSGRLPEWYLPFRKLFGMISVVEVSLTYLATAFFAGSFKLAGWFGTVSSRIYIAVSVMAFLILVVSPFSPDPFATAGFILSIPAVPLIIPYLMGVNLLWRMGSSSGDQSPVV